MRSKNPALMKKIQEFAESYYREHGETPSNKVIADAMGMGKSTVYYYLVEMAKRGMISYKNGEISTDKIRKLTPEVSRKFVGVKNFLKTLSNPAFQPADQLFL